ncbi:MAG TPA: folate-binding protein [Croceicoccus sp.]|nr:folate-binding protein [Croceicoccus sp.]
MTIKPGATRLCGRAVIRLSGAEGGNGGDVAEFLQGLVTNDVARALPVWTALLSPQGKVLFDFFVWPARDALLIDCEKAHAEDLVKRLTMYRLRRPIGIALDDAVAVHWTAHIGDGGADDPRLAALGQRWLAPVGNGMQECADAAYLAHRLALGVTEGRAELGYDKTLWLECNAAELHGVSFSKGCYVGQENTARMNWRQKVNRRLAVVPLARSSEASRSVAYPELDVAVERLRVADVSPDAFPKWLAPALRAATSDERD